MDCDLLCNVLFQVYGSNEYTSICILDGLTYSANIGGIVRSVYAMDGNIVFVCPPSLTMYKKFLADEKETGYKHKSIYLNDDGKPVFNSQFKKDVERSSCDRGHIRTMNIFYDFTAGEVINILNEFGYNIVMYEMSRSSKHIYLDEVDFSARHFAYILGNEKYGISDELYAQGEFDGIACIEIRTGKNRQSLNVCSANAIFINKRFECIHKKTSTM